jgi:hypothetical protein
VRKKIMRREMVIGTQNHETVSGVHPEVLAGGGRGTEPLYNLILKTVVISITQPLFTTAFIYIQI